MKALSENARKLRNQYVRVWRAKNKNKVKEANRLYWERRAERLNSEILESETIKKGGGNE